MPGGSNNRERVVITGMGAVSPLGATVEETWSNVVAGRSGIGRITRFDPTGYETSFAGEVKEFDPADILGKKEARRMDRFTQFAVAAGLEAAALAGLTPGTFDPVRAGALIGTGMGAMETLENGAETLLTQGPGRLGPFFAPMVLPNMAAGMAAIALGAKGPTFATVSACASAGHAIGEGTRMIREGLADIMFCGGGEAPVTRLGVAGFNAMGALSKRNDDPAGASRPFDADRDGFVLAEGGVVLVLESYEHAVSRGAVILGEVSGYGTTDDATHIVQPAPGGEGAARAITLALKDARLAPTEIDYINAHGTSTQLNEKLETQAIKSAFGAHAARVAISSTKSMTGHLLGAAGALEAVICLKAIAEGCIPPTINYTTPDPDCDLDYVPNSARPAQLRHVLSNSMGFGGHNVALVLSAYDV
ncbi:MAG: 3-oxoacyl-[acyl-carrier-protein] synthase [Thermomicrobiales bacterium]|jgi:3-oxoacyl-[acyl-carrier-protein] synthase II|nr:3-oxoacyl-[acyl-carrier-protein] synthase [Thermomicrobiales bacterium]MEA2531510.1 3-oxoacyl-[acyl-carrier-protein] synthase [Thermomicrobiales bacterium]